MISSANRRRHEDEPQDGLEYGGVDRGRYGNLGIVTETVSGRSGGAVRVFEDAEGKGKAPTPSPGSKNSDLGEGFKTTAHGPTEPGRKTFARKIFARQTTAARVFTGGL
ncbi:MAG: hypothetical protein LBM17_02425 [Candidatus Accumulibacter sp.]|nr:hypothetical protein [Accumulibacter sp.]